jgi:hypothetical protein
MRYGRILISGALMAMSGCGSPSKANIALRKENQDLNQRLAILELELKSNQAYVPVTQPAFDRTFTVHEVTLGRLGNANMDRVKIYLEPRDDEDEPIKAPGDVSIDVYDLSTSPNAPLDHWECSAEELRDKWRQLGSLHAFVVDLPWHKLPNTKEIGATVRFKDALTLRMYHVVGKIPWER